MNGKPSAAPASAASVRQYLADHGLSVRAVAARLGVHPGHLQRVLIGERAGSRAYLQSVLAMARSMPDRRPAPVETGSRLLDAALHVFFLKRGDYESVICAGARRRRTG
jgi:transcriptional regulator with XRE-family HTH domain